MDLDRFIAEKVMGWELCGEQDHTKPLHKKSNDFHGTIIDDWGSKGPHPRLEHPDGMVFFLCNCQNSKGDELPKYSTDIAQAFKVVERMRELGWTFRSEAFPGEITADTDIIYWAEFSRDNFMYGGQSPPGTKLMATAICLAAKAALEDK